MTCNLFVIVAQAWARNVQAGKLSKGDRLGPADHSKFDYPPFRRNFYIEVPELARMSEEAVAERRKELDGIKVRSPNSNDKAKKFLSRSFLRAGLPPPTPTLIQHGLRACLST